MVLSEDLHKSIGCQCAFAACLRFISLHLCLCTAVKLDGLTVVKDRVFHSNETTQVRCHFAGNTEEKGVWGISTNYVEVRGELYIFLLIL